MATLYGSQYAANYNTVPNQRTQAGDQNAAVKRIYFSYAVAAAVIALNDVIKLARLPKGARIYNAALKFPDQGTTGTSTLGWAASPELSGGSAVEAADDDGLLTTVDMKAARDFVTLTQQMEAGGNVAGHLKKFAAEVDVQLKITEATDVGTGTIEGYIEFTLD